MGGTTTRSRWLCSTSRAVRDSPAPGPSAPQSLQQCLSMAMQGSGTQLVSNPSVPFWLDALHLGQAPVTSCGTSVWRCGWYRFVKID